MLGFYGGVGWEVRGACWIPKIERAGSDKMTGVPCADEKKKENACLSPGAACDATAI
jgi:hypothetical protein